MIGYRHDFAKVFFFFFLIFIFPFELLSRFVVLKYRAIPFTPRFVNSKTVPILSAFFLSNQAGSDRGTNLSSVHIVDFHPIM